MVNVKDFTFSRCALTDHIVASNGIYTAAFAPNSAGLRLVYSNLPDQKSDAKIALATTRHVRRNKGE